MRRSILCVEDNAQDRALLRSALDGFDVTFACNAAEALRAFHTGVFDAYVLEYWLPDWTGYALCRDLRKTDPHAPVIVYTRAHPEPHRGKSLRAGATAFLMKSEMEPAALARYLADLLRAVDVVNLNARIEEERAVAEEIRRRMTDAAESMDKGRLLMNSALERSARVKGMMAFFERRGSKAHFDRTWPQIFARLRAAAQTET